MEWSSNVLALLYLLQRQVSNYGGKNMKIEICCKRMQELLYGGYVYLSIANKIVLMELGADFVGGGSVVTLYYCPNCGKKIEFKGVKE